MRPLRIPPPLPLLRDIVTELKLVWALAPPPPLAELELKPPLVEYVRRDTEDLMAVRGAEHRLRELRGSPVSFWATDGLFIFSRLGWVLGSTGTPAPSPQEERERPCGLGGWGVPLPQQEGWATPSYHLCSRAETRADCVGRDCVGRDATFHPLGLSCLGTR